MEKPETEAALKQDREWTNQRHRQLWNKTENGQTRDTGSIERRHIMDKPVTLTELRQDTKGTNQRHMRLVCPFCVLSQYCLCLRFVHHMSYLNATCVSGLSILSLVSMLHVPLISPLCVLSQYRMCLWFVPFVSCLNSVSVTGLTQNGQTSHKKHWDKTQNG
jgi:hypothetical protein